MSDRTNIQWADGTINPVMGCDGCELFKPPGVICALLDATLRGYGSWAAGTSLRLFEALTAKVVGSSSEPIKVSTTNIWHLREMFQAEVAKRLGRDAAKSAELVIAKAITCYAAKLHLNRGTAITNPERQPNKGYAPVFEEVTLFPGRVAAMARSRDLGNSHDPDKPWLEGCRHLVFVSDMGDAFSRPSDFDFLKEDVMPQFASEKGSRKFWLWLTKRPQTMARFGEEIGGFPDNVCAMTTITGPDTLYRLDHLRRIPAKVKGVSAEPVWERIDPSRLNLGGIDWLILGGESGRKDVVRPFDLSWARELRDHCAEAGVAFFLKQLGRRPEEGGLPLELRDAHGGDWDEWPEDLRVRQVPAAFRSAAAPAGYAPAQAA
jgi:protein gp37